ncbi:MAG: DUF4351 domain-containing protein [Trichodesmium sp.]
MSLAKQESRIEEAVKQILRQIRRLLGELSPKFTNQIKSL